MKTTQIYLFVFQGGAASPQADDSFWCSYRVENV